MNKRLLPYIFILFLSFFIVNLKAQCPQVYDGNGAPSSNPYWISCSGGSYTLNFSSPSTLTGYSIDWGDGSAVSSGASLAANTFLPHTYSATVDTFILTLTTTTPACTLSGVVVMEKPVNASIQIPIGGVTTACAPKDLQFTNSSTDVSATTTFTWNFGDGSPILTFDETNAGQTVTHTYLKGTVNCQTIVTLTAQNYCSFGTPTSAQFNPIQIYDIDDADITPSDYVKCWPDNVFDFSNTTNRNCVPQGNVAQRYEKWDFGDYWGKGHDSIIDWTPWPPSFPHTLAYLAVGNYNVTLYDSNMCGIDTITIFVSIVNPPTAGVTALSNNVCAGTPMTFNNTSTSGYSYAWNFGDNATYTQTAAGPQTHTYNAGGTYTVTVVAFILGASGSCSDTAHVVVTVKPNPTSAFTRTPGLGCDTITVVCTDASTNAAGWNWTFGNGNISTSQNPPNQNYTAGNYTITLTVTAANGCTNTSTQPVNVFISPVAVFSPTSTCQNSLTQFTDASTHSVGDPLTSWTWDFGDATPTSALQNPSHIYTSGNTFTITLNVSTAHCSGSANVPISVNPLPVAAFTRLPISGCGPLNVIYQNNSSGATTYNWDFGNGTTSIATNPSEIFVNTNTTDTVFTTQLIATTAAGCKDTITDTVLVFGKPVAAFNFTTPPGCAPFPISFNNTSQAAISYSWDFGDTTASTAFAPVHMYQNTTFFVQNYTITLIATNAGGCTDTATQTVTVNPQPLFGFSIVPTSGCTPLPVSFPSVAGAVLYEWDFGDGNTSTGANPVHTYTNSTSGDITYNVQLIATNAFNCKDTTTGTVLIHALPVAAFTKSTGIGCQPLNAIFTNTTPGVNTYVWDFGDGSATATSTNATHTFINNSTSASDTFHVSLETTNSFGCKDTAVSSVIVYPNVIAAFYADTPICAPVNVMFHNLSQGANSYNWNLGDGNFSSLDSLTHSYTNNGPGNLIYTVSLTATSTFGCTSVFNKAYTVYPMPQVAFTASPLSQTYPAATVIFTNNTPNAAGFASAWNFGDSATVNIISPGPHTYQYWGPHTITLVMASQFCKDSATHTINIIPPVPIAGFKGSFSGCSPLTVHMQNTSLYGSTYQWNFGDGLGTSSSKNPTYTYNTAGSFTITLTVTGAGGVNTISGIDSAIVYPLPTAVFGILDTNITIPTDDITTINASSGAVSYLWNFGDGTTSTEYNPTHTYTAPGDYEVFLIAYSSHNCVDTSNYKKNIHAEEASDIVVPNAFTPNPTAASSDGIYDPNAKDNDVFHPVIHGVIKYELSIYSRWGELLFDTKDLRIGWDGYYKGKLCTQDVYIWKLKATTHDGKQINKAGDLLLIRP